MKITVDRAALKSALDRVIAITPPKTTMPIIGNIRLEAAADGLLRLQATDLEIMATTRLAARIDAPGAITLPGRRLAEFVGNAAGEVTIDVPTAGGLCAVASGRYRAKLQSLPADDWPDWPFADASCRFGLAGRDLAALIDATIHAVTEDDTRIYLQGIFLHAGRIDGEARLVAVATDGYRLARAAVSLPDGAEALAGLILPARAAGHIRKLATAAGEAKVAVEASDSKIKVSTEETSILSVQIDGSFPDYPRMIPADLPHRATIARADLAGGIKRVGMVLAERTAATRLGFSELACRIEAWGAAVGAATDEVAAGCAAATPPPPIALNTRYLTEAVEIFPTGRLAVDFGTGGTPVLFRLEDAAGDGVDRLSLVCQMQWRGPPDASVPA